MLNYKDQANIIGDVLLKHPLITVPTFRTLRWDSEQNAWSVCNSLEAFIDYTEITHDKRFLKLIRQISTDSQFIQTVMGDGVDDEAWAGIALVKTYRLTRDKSRLEVAKTIFDSMVTYWDDTCLGGVWWNFKRTYKNAITNELFLVLAVLLYQETHKATYLDWAKKEWDWFAKSGMINSDSLINDGLTGDCKNNQATTWTYNQGVVLGGLTGLYRITHDKAYLEQASKIAVATMSRLVAPVDGVPVLLEPVNNDLNSDQQQFKGIFVRYLAQLAHELPEEGPTGRKAIRNFVCSNADSVWKNARNEANEVNVYWHKSDNKPIHNATTQSSALDLFNAAISLSR